MGLLNNDLLNSEVLIQIKAAREGSNVKRCHTMPILGEYTDGKHSYDALNLVLFLHPGPSLNLIKAVMWHDLGERWAGDAPHPAVRRDVEFGAAYRRVEAAGMAHHNIFLPELTEDEQEWLSGVDKLELLLWAMEQVHMGNKPAQSYVTTLLKWFDDNKAKVPPRVLFVVEHYNVERLDDTF